MSGFLGLPRSTRPRLLRLFSVIAASCIVAAPALGHDNHPRHSKEKLPGFIAQATGGNPEEQLQAIDDIAYVHPQSAARHAFVSLLEKLELKSPALIEQVLRTAMVLNEKGGKVEEIAEASLSTGAPAGQRMGLIAAARFFPEKALSHARQLAGSANEEVSFRAGEILSKSEDVKDAELGILTLARRIVLKSELEHDEMYMFARSYRPAELLDRIINRKPALVKDAINPHQEELVPILLGALDHKNLVVRGAAAKALALVEPRQNRIAGALLNVLKQEERPVLRAVLLDALQHYPDLAKDTAAEAAKSLSSAVPLERRAAVKLLGKQGQQDPQYIAVLAHSLRDADPEVRIYSAWALGRYGGDAAEAVPLLIQAVNKEGIAVRERAWLIKALRQIGTTDAQTEVKKQFKALGVDESKVDAASGTGGSDAKPAS